MAQRAHVTASWSTLVRYGGPVSASRDTYGLLAVDDGQRLYWETCGSPTGTPVVVLHGGPGSGCTPTMRRFFDPDA